MKPDPAPASAASSAVEPAALPPSARAAAIGKVLPEQAPQPKEAELSESERFIKSVVEASPHWFYVFDFDSMGLTYANRPILADLGYPPDVHTTVTGLEAFRAFMPPEEMPHLARLIEEWRTLPDGLVRDDEYCLRHADGTLHYFAGREVVFARRADGTVQRILGTLLDITGHKRAETALRESEERLKRSQELAHVGSWELDVAQDRLTWSDEVYRIFGLRPQEFCATYEAFLERVYPDDRRKVDDAYSGSLRENRDAYEVEHRVVRKDTGEVRVVREKCEHFRDAAGKIIRSVGMVQDISERKQWEDALRFVGERGWAPTGEDFFQALARYLAENLGADFVCIDRLQEGSLAAETVAVFFEGKFQDNITYALKDTPCGDVVGKAICCFPRDVRALFPKDAVLQEMGAEGYLGTTLWSAQAKPIGLIALIWRRPLADTQMASSILHLMAMRAAGELERRQAEQELRESEARAKVAAAVHAERERLQEVLDMLPAYVVLLARDYQVPVANRFFEERFGKSEGRRCYEYLFHRTAPCENCQTYNVLKTNAPQRWEWTGPDGRNYDIYDFPFADMDGSPLIMEVGLDITEQKQAEAELAKHREHLQELVNERTAELLAANTELTRFNAAMVGRELRMIELKQEINALCAQLSQPSRYWPKPDAKTSAALNTDSKPESSCNYEI